MRAVDLFAGAGGFSTGAVAAGARVVWAANHWRQAVDTHARNHPGVVHSCQDLQQADWRDVPAHDLLLASPACQAHSNAATRGGTGCRGTAPRHDYLRSTAWAVVSCAEVHRRRNAAQRVENMTPSQLRRVRAAGAARSRLYRRRRAQEREEGRG